MMNNTLFPSDNNLSNKEPWGDKDWIWTIMILISAVLLRFFDLGDKPYHHDEAIFGMYAYYHFDAPTTNFYKYLPMLNGPLLFHLQFIIYKIFGATDVSGRLIPAFLGSALVFVPLYFRKILNKQLFFFILILVGFSPVFIYFSRFLRHEYLVLSVYVLFLYFLLVNKSPWRFFALPFLIWIHWCIKENVYVFVAILLGFLIFEAAVQYLRKKYQQTISDQFKNYYLPNNAQSWTMVSLGLLLGLIVFYLLYSNYGVYNEGFLDGLYKKGFTYWLDQHKTERIKGPFSIHFMMMNWYELIAFFTVVSAIVIQIKKYYSQKQKTIILIYSFLCVLMSLIFSSQLLQNYFFQDILKLKITLDLFLFFILIFLAVFHSFILLWKDQLLHAFLFYLFIANFFSYSYLGEKVPWLVMYPLFFGIILSAYVFHREKVWESMQSWKINNTLTASTYLLLLCASYNLTTGIRTSFFRSANIQEFIIQVHPVHAYKNILKHIIETTRLKKNSPLPQILVMDDATWITTWYFKDERYPTVFDRNSKPLDTIDLILSKDANLNLDATHNKVEVDYSGWWVPDYQKFNLVSFYQYAINHQAWSESGLMKYYLYTRKGFYDP